MMKRGTLTKYRNGTWYIGKKEENKHKVTTSREANLLVVEKTCTTKTKTMEEYDSSLFYLAATLVVLAVINAALVGVVVLSVF
jgi:hypothetical protein